MVVCQQSVHTAPRALHASSLPVTANAPMDFHCAQWASLDNRQAHSWGSWRYVVRWCHAIRTYPQPRAPAADAAITPQRPSPRAPPEGRGEGCVGGLGSHKDRQLPHGVAQWGTGGGGGRALLEGEGGPSGQSQSSCRAVTGDVKAVGGGGFWRLEMRLGYGNAFRVESAQWGGGRGVPPPFKRFPGGGGCPSLFENLYRQTGHSFGHRMQWQGHLPKGMRASCSAMCAVNDTTANWAKGAEERTAHWVPDPLPLPLFECIPDPAPVGAERRGGSGPPPRPPPPFK